MALDECEHHEADEQEHEHEQFDQADHALRLRPGEHAQRRVVPGRVFTAANSVGGGLVGKLVPITGEIAEVVYR